MKIVGRYFLLCVFFFVACCLCQNSAHATTTIKNLVDKARPGQTVKIPPGIFIENVVVPPGISIAGASSQKTIVVGSVELSGGPQNPAALSRMTVIHTGGRSSAVTCKGGSFSIHHSHLVSEGGFAAVEAGACKALLRNNIIVGPVGDYAIFGRGGGDIDVINNTIVVQGFGIGLMDQSFATIRNCLFYGNAKPAVIRTDSDYTLSYSNISLSGGSFYFYHDLINNDIKLRDRHNYPANPTPADVTNKDFPKYDSIGLTSIFQDFAKYRTVAEYRKHQPSFALHAGSPEEEYNNADGSRNNLGAFGGPLGAKGW